MSTNWNTKVAAAFGYKAPHYAHYANVQAQIAGMLLRDLPERAASILEIGCGTGILSKMLAEHYPSTPLHITDISADMLEAAALTLSHTAHPALCSMVLDGEHDIIGNQRFSLITGNMVCQWFGNIEGGIANMDTMLDDDGALYLTMPGPGSFREWRSTLQSLGLPDGMLDFTQPRGVYKREIIHQPVENAMHFLHILKNTGAATSKQGYNPLGLCALKAACNAFDAQGFKTITWEILFIRRKKN